jgi:protein involved in polysaccharide export with SLBB domain
MSCAASASVVVLLVAVGLGGCASSEPPPTVVPSVEPDQTLGPGDTFEVSVYGEEDLSGKHQIAEDGTIRFPLVGRIEAAGKGPVEIADAIRAALTEKQVLRDPHVSVFLLDQTSNQVSVMGAVVKPGRYPVTIGMTVIEAIGAAGGLTPLASGNNTIVTRHVDGQLRRFTVQVERISEGHVADFKLHTGDIVYVPERIF